MKKKSWVSRINIFIRSLLFSAFMSIYTIFYSFLSVSLFPFPLRYRFAMIMAWNIME